jgi:signal transduction histidine kinase
MRSLYTRILLASVGTVLLALAAFLGMYSLFTQPAIRNMIHAFENVLADGAVDAFQRGGAPAAAAYLAHVDATLPIQSTRYLIDDSGRDVVTGADHSDLRRPDGTWRARDAQGRDIFVHRSSDGRHAMLIAIAPPVGLTAFLPYYALILGAVALVCWMLAVGIASPIREMAAVVNEFGRGHFSARAPIVRHDEIGELARAFNTMADRIETLVTAERRLLQDVSHELRSPLTRLSMAIELSRTASDRNAAADRLQRQADRLAHLVGALLDVTRLEGDAASDQPPDLVDIAVVVRGIVTECEVEAEARGCHIGVDACAGLHVPGNAELLRRAFENTLRNAIRYAPVGSLIEVQCQERGSEAVLSIRDFGPGVPEEALPQLGSPFYRVDASRDLSTGGLGLGLSITRRAIHLHRGTWTVENAHPGLRVVITIPSASRAA